MAHVSALGPDSIGQGAQGYTIYVTTDSTLIGDGTTHPKCFYQSWNHEFVY